MEVVIQVLMLITAATKSYAHSSLMTLIFVATILTTTTTIIMSGGECGRTESCGQQEQQERYNRTHKQSATGTSHGRSHGTNTSAGIRPKHARRCIDWGAKVGTPDLSVCVCVREILFGIILYRMLNLRLLLLDLFGCFGLWLLPQLRCLKQAEKQAKKAEDRAKKKAEDRAKKAEKQAKKARLQVVS